MNRLTAILLFLLPLPALTGQVEIVDVSTRTSNPGVYRFDVTLKHGDTGWDHYADRWRVLTPDGQLLGERILYHPHVDEQPFTRSLSGVRIPPGATEFLIRARDSVHGETERSFMMSGPPEKEGEHHKKK